MAVRAVEAIKKGQELSVQVRGRLTGQPRGGRSSRRRGRRRNLCAVRFWH